MAQSENKNKATIEERAYKAVPDMLRINENYVASFVCGYYQGATEQHKIDIDKACSWLRQHAISVINIEAFRKAMEK